MSNIKNLNEEISRIKSLFGEERLYGNLIGESLNINEEKELIMEQAKPIRMFLDGLLNTLKKSGKKQIRSKVDGVETIYKISPEGVISKNGKKIDESKISSFLSRGLKSKIENQLATITSKEESFLKYLSQEGYNGVSLEKHLNEIIDDMSKQELITKGDAQKVKNNIKQSKIYGRIDEIFTNTEMRQKFAKSINSDMSFGKNYPSIKEVFDAIPSLKKEYFDSSIFGNGKKIISDEYDSIVTIMDILQNYKGTVLDKKGNIIKGTTLSPWNHYFTKKKKIGAEETETILNLNYNSIDKDIGKHVVLKNDMEEGYKLPIDIVRELKREIKKINEVNPNVKITIDGTGNITFSAKKLTNSEIENIQKIHDKEGVMSLPAKNKPTSVVPEKTRTLPLDNVFLDNKKILDPSSTYYKKRFSNFIKKMGWGLGNLKNNNFIRSIVDKFTWKLSRFLDPIYLRKNNYSLGGGGTKEIDANHETLLNSIWEIKVPQKGESKSIFIETAEDELIYGIGKGEIKPNLSKKVKWKTEFNENYKKIVKIFNFGIKGDYRRVAKDKLVRNYIIQLGTTFTVTKLLYNAFYYEQRVTYEVLSEAVDQKIEAWKDIMKSEKMNPTVLLPLVEISYEQKCKDALFENIQTIFGAGAMAIQENYFGDNGKLKRIFEVSAEPSVFTEEGYNSVDKLPVLTEVNYKIDTIDIDGLILPNFGKVIKGDDGKYKIITVPIDDKIMEIPLSCGETFEDYWYKNWKEVNLLKNDEGALATKVKELGKEINWDEINVNEIKDWFNNITVDLVVEKVKDISDEVKEAGENLKTAIENESSGSGDVGEVGVYN